MDLSPCTRVYIWGGRWVGNQRDSGPCDLVLVYRFLSTKDLWIFSFWCGGYLTWDTSMILWHTSHLFGSTICQNLWKDSWDPVGACLSPSYTNNKQFSESRLLAIIGLPWPMTHIHKNWWGDFHTPYVLAWWSRRHLRKSSSTWQHNLCPWDNNSMTLAHQHNEPRRRQTSQDDYVFIKTEFSESFDNFSSYLSMVFNFSEV